MSRAPVRLVAGIDIGNTTTEVVIGWVARDRVDVVATARALTRRAKGSPESLAGAVALVRRLERQHDVRVQRAVAAPLRPVATLTAALPEEAAETGRLWVAKAGASTAGGAGSGVGRPVPFGAMPDGDDAVVVAVRRGTRYDVVATGLAPLVATGRLAAVLVEEDEGVLVGNRLDLDVPVVDQVDVSAVLAADLVAVEVTRLGRPLQLLSDPLRLGRALGLREDEIGCAARLAPHLFDATNAVVALGGGAPGPARRSVGWVDVADHGRLPFWQAQRHVRTGPVGAARAFALPPDEAPHHVDDLWTVDLAAVAEAVQARQGAARSRPVTVAALFRDVPVTDPADALSSALGVPVETQPSEAHAARAGAVLGSPAREDAVVVDLGGGTVDVMSASGVVVAAGAGQLLTASVAALTGGTEAASEWVKRGPAHRVEAPQLLLAEDGTRGFLDRPAPRETIGSLVVHGPAGLLPFSATLAPSEWRGLRRRLKVQLLGGNVARGLHTLGLRPDTVVVVGGSAGDEEVLAAVSGALPPGTAVSRADVGGHLGHRFAVAYGLLVLLSRSSPDG